MTSPQSASTGLPAMPLWRPIRGGNTFESTVERLAQAIKLGVVERGERLPPERELAGRLQISRVTLREAIRALREAGFVESRRGRSGGTFVVYQGSEPVVDDADQRARAAALVRDMGPDLDDALEFRRVVEAGAAALAARRTLSASDRQRLAGRLRASRDRDPGSRRISDSRLHLAIVAASGCPSLVAAVSDVQLRLDGLLSAIPVLRRNLDHSDEQHAGVVDAIFAGASDKARITMEEHCDATAALLRGLLA